MTQYDKMSSLAIYKKIDELYEMYESVLNNNVKNITVPAYTKTLDQYLSDSVLTYVFGYWKYDEAIKFINIVRKHNIVMYDAIITYVISERRSNNKTKIKDLIEMSLQDNYKLNYQKLVNHGIDNDDSDIVDLLKESADKIKYQFDFDTMHKKINFIEKIITWAKLTNQKINLDIQNFFESSGIRGYHYFEYLLKLNQDEYKQNLNFNRILSLNISDKMVTTIKKYVPNDYKFDVYSEDLEINLKNYSKKELQSILHDLIKYCYETTEIECIEYKNKKYYNSSNLWYDRKQENMEHDPDIECENYMDDCDFDTINPKNPDNVKYLIEYDKNRTHWTYDYDNIDLIRKISYADIEKVMLTGYDLIMIINKCGRNNDHRGSDHCKIYLQMYGKYEINLPINLFEFANCLYRIKSHKWDNHYELYCGIKTPCSQIYKYYDDNLLIEQNGLNILFEFDHGS